MAPLSAAAAQLYFYAYSALMGLSLAPQFPLLISATPDYLGAAHAANGVGLAAPQIGVLLRVVIFGFEHNDRYPDAEPVPYTEIVNPVLTPVSAAIV